MKKTFGKKGVFWVGFVCIGFFLAGHAGADPAVTAAAPKLPSADLRQLTTGDCTSWNGDWSPDGKWIVYQRDKTGQSWKADIYKIRVDGTEETQLTSGYYCDSKPQFSPNGKQIVFQRNTLAEGASKVGEKSSIWVMNADGSNQKQIVAPMEEDKGGAQWPFWSPDGKWIAYMYGERRQKGLWVIKADGTGPQEVIPADFGEVPGIAMDWKPKGSKKQILVSVRTESREAPSKRGRHIALVEFDPKGKKPTTQTWLTDSSSDTADQTYSKWSPNGKSIVYSDDSNNRADIWLMNSDGTNKVRLTDSASNNDACYNHPNWSPNGKYLAYQTSEGTSSRSKRKIYIMTADGLYKNCLMSDENIRQSGRSDYLLHFNRKGTMILFEGRDQTTNKDQLFVLELHK